MDFTGLHRTLCPAKQSNLRACTVGRHKSTMDKLSEQSVTVEREHTQDIVSLSHRPHLSDLLTQTVNIDYADWLFICSRFLLLTVHSCWNVNGAGVVSADAAVRSQE